MADNDTIDYKGFSLVSGGLIYSLTSVFRGKSGSKKGLLRTALALGVITWGVLCVLSLLNGRFLDDTSSVGFFEDFLTHVRYLLIVPFLILIEGMVDKSFIRYVKNTELIMSAEEKGAFVKLAYRLDKLTDSYIPEILILVFLYSYMAFNWEAVSTLGANRSYLYQLGTNSLNATGWYYLLVCTPVLQMLVFRWFWRWMVWVYSILAISRMNIILDPLHADQMAGLQYLNLVPFTFGMILMAPSVLLSAMIGMDIIYNGATLMEYKFQIIVYVAILPIILYLPLAVYLFKLYRAKAQGVIQFGDLLRKHDLEYVNKWITNASSNKEPLLGSVDHSALADINGSYGPLTSMKLVPIDLKLILLSIALNVLPYIPLVFTFYSVSELFQILVNDVLNS